VICLQEENISHRTKKAYRCWPIAELYHTQLY